MSSVFHDTKRAGYRSQRAISQGAGITLLSTSGGYVAQFECAKNAALVLGNRELQDLGDGIYESIPMLFIPTEGMNAALQKLTGRFSVALVDLVCDDTASRFVLVWKAEQRVQTLSTDISDY